MRTCKTLAFLLLASAATVARAEDETGLEKRIEQKSVENLTPEKNSGPVETPELKRKVLKKKQKKKPAKIPVKH